VINPWNLDALESIEQETGKRIHPVLQLRYAGITQRLQQEIKNTATFVNAELKYFTPRGRWVFSSWKMNKEKSGGTILNIGVHLFDFLLHIFGPCQKFDVTKFDKTKSSGTLYFEKASVAWKLSIDPTDCVTRKPERTLTLDHDLYDLTNEFTNLHDIVYRETLAGRGLTIAETRSSIELIYNIRKHVNDI
jgi:UDP-N-acetyl-2-amino-2-deoxyglucuronate dehydrogenase